MASGETYLRWAGYNPDRQFELASMPRVELEKVVGKRINPNARGAFTEAVKEQLAKEGYKYLVRSDVIRNDPFYREYAGIPDRPGFVTKAEYLKKNHIEDRPIQPDNQRESDGTIIAMSVFACIVAIILCLAESIH